jgi:hypothetical protein
MKKALFTCCLLVFSLPSFSQQEIENLSHPYQVLFVDSAYYIGKQEKVNQFDFLDKYELIRNRGKLILIHYSGEVVEISEGIVNLNDYSKERNHKNYIERPLISDPSNFINISNIQQSTGGYLICNPSPIFITYPDLIRYDTPELFAHEILHLVWKSNEGRGAKYIVFYKNIFDEIIFSDTVETASISTPVEKLITNEGLLIVRVVDASNYDISSGDIGFRVKTETKKGQDNLSKYSVLLDALHFASSQEPETAQQLFLISIINSNQDPLFIQLYEDFLERNPQFK